MTTTPVLFLDIDGVLNCEATFRARRPARSHRIDRTMVARLNEVVEATQCLVVVSSSWRGLDRLRAVLRSYGFQGRFHRDWRTEWGQSHHRRGHEIAHWLSRHLSPPFAIVDDESDMLPEQMPRLVQTNFQTGLTDEHASRLVALLAPSLSTDGRA